MNPKEKDMLREKVGVDAEGTYSRKYELMCYPSFINGQKRWKLKDMHR